jgi:hypothetical protein
MSDISGRAAEAVPEPQSRAVAQVGWVFVSLFTLKYLRTCLVLAAGSWWSPWP